MGWQHGKKPKTGFLNQDLDYYISTFGINFNIGLTKWIEKWKK